MATISTDRPGGIPISRAPRAIWTRVTTLALKLNGSAMPLELQAGDRAELERTIFG